LYRNNQSLVLKSSSPYDECALCRILTRTVQLVIRVPAYVHNSAIS